MRVLQAYEVLDTALGPRKDGDVVPWLLLAGLHYGTGEVEGTVLVSSWTAFDGVFPMNGTYFFQNEVFEDEAKGKVTVPKEALGPMHTVYIGRSVEGVLRGRTREQLTDIFQQSFVCIRRFRSADRRLLPLILDQPKLIKYDCEPSAIAVDSGLQQACCPLPPVDKKDHGAVVDTPEMRRGLRLFAIYETARGR